MSANNLARNAVAKRFDRAASGYNAAASVQAQIAARLVEKAARRVEKSPASILDIGCGTGLVADAALRVWPRADVTAIDGAPAMLRQAQRKIPQLRVIEGDIADRPIASDFDLVLSSMALHWLPDPKAALENWRGWLKTGGRLFAALLTEGSFQEWRDLCAAAGLADGLWNFPARDFAGDFVTEQQALRIDYPSAKDFLRRLKATGASMPRAGHKPFAIARMRRLLDRAPVPFSVTYSVLYIEAPRSISI